MNEELAGAYAVVEGVDESVPGEVVVLSMMDTYLKADSFCEQSSQVAGFNGTNGFAVWNLAQGGKYWLFCQMTAEDPRPLCLSINDTVISKAVCASTTGSWKADDLQWFHYGPFEMEGSVKLDTDGYWPHVKRFVLVPTTASPETSATTSRAVSSYKSEPDGEPQLLQLNHAQVTERLASIPNRLPDGMHNFMAALRQPKNMSDNVRVSDAMIIVEGGRGYYEFEIINEVWAKEVYLDVTYASGDTRPVTLTFNGDAVEECCCAAETGGYGVENFVNTRCGPFPIQSEVNMIKVTATKGFFPHISEIRVVDANTESKEVTKRSHGTWIVPPSSPLRPELPLQDFCYIENTQDANPDFEPDPAFYNGINLDGFWVLASKEVDKRILNQAAELLCRYIPVEIRRLCLQWRAPKGMPQGPFRLVILDPVTDQKAGDCPDFPDSWGGRNGTSNPGIFTSADDFSLHPQRFGPCGELTVHEVTHGLDMVIRQQLDPYFFQQTHDCWQDAIDRKVYRKAYAAANRHEYLAEICTLFVGTGPTNFLKGCFQCTESETGMCEWEPHRAFCRGKGGVEFTKKSHLIKNDPMGYEFLKTFLIEIKDPEDDSFWWEYGTVG
mmetsp:Transcript_12267/g.20323  ORF Transcript_12267/g.20323 Transcript_12267/m.20323 type:complete len:610 (-) Transcript_12267:100-1929(-)